MIIRVGVSAGRKAVLNRALEMGASVLVSANTLWDNRAQRFTPWKRLASTDVALDSGGFVAMKKYGGYRWSVRQYVELARVMSPTWWAQMDFCCEPEIASDSTEVWARIGKTVAHLQECQRVAGGENVPMPMPVLQGWRPGDYIRGPIFDDQDFPWPELVGVGSVCRRQVNGPTGIMAVVEALHMKLPPHVQLHLFGVKSQAISALLKEFPARIASVDSMAWNMAARWDAWHAGVPLLEGVRVETMSKWYLRQRNMADAAVMSDEQLLLLIGEA